MDVAYRPARPEDLEPSGRIVQQAILDLRQQHGVALPQPLGPPAFQRFCLEEDPSGLWVAEAGGELVGWTMSWMCGRFWFLSQLFVRPDLQAKGVGQALLDRPMAQAVRREAANRALITFAYNTRDWALYPQRDVPTGAALPRGCTGCGVARRPGRRGARGGGDRKHNRGAGLARRD
jgi:GNAT superfamily N-acetyltransferase